MNAASAALLAETRRRPGRLLLTGLAVTVATVFAAGTLLLGETMRSYLTATSMQTPTAAAAVVLPERLPDAARADLVDRVAAVDGVTAAVGVWTRFASVRGPGVAGMWRLGSDPMGGPLTRLPSGAQEGRLPAAGDEVAVGAGTAERTGVRPGTRLVVESPTSPRQVVVTGVVALPTEAVNSLIALPHAVATLGGTLDQVDVTSSEVDAEITIGAVLGAPDAVRTSAEQRAAEARQASGTVDAVLAGVSVFAGLALVAAAVVVASTFRIVLTQRRTQLALLRCVGAGRGQLVRAVLAEATVSGVVAGVLGAGVAVAAGYALVSALRLGGLDAPALVVPWPGIAAAGLMAVAATVVAALVPAVAAGRTPPVAALGAAGAAETGVPRRGPRVMVAAGLGMVAAGLAVLAVTGGGGELALVMLAVSGLVGFAALVASGPLLVGALVATAGRAVAALGRGPGRLAVANARQVPRRTAATIAVLTLGVGLTSALLVALAQTEAGAQRTIARQFPTEIIVTASDPGSVAALARRLGTHPALRVRAEAEQVLIDPAPGVDIAAARGAVDRALGPDALVSYAGDLRAELESTLATARLIGLGLVGMTVLVAVVGVGVTLMLSVTERTRETGLLRAVGLTRRGVRSMIAWEAALCGLAAAVVGALIGAAYGLLGVRALDAGLESWTIPWSQLAVVVAGIVTTAVLAAVAPAVRAGQTPPIVAVSA
ncbi:FtsX-like permease family protein [Pseudonocardia hispaniensis]|uniref:FtsX-like permease family protein n=1 Tax=Pseudonocardia hispaniensis TaxID=904933 RepID=A0ABW1J3N1_9PSEU